MINLLDGENFCQRQDETLGLNNQLNIIIQNKLQDGLDKQELIYTKDLRGIGKTYALIQFAKKYDLNVVVMSHMVMRILRDKYNYEKIYSQEDIGINNKNCIIDECVNIELLKQRGINILTGFTEIKNQAIKKGKITCKKCEQELDEKDFYLVNNKRFHICKKCIDRYDYKNLSEFIKLLVKMDIPFIENIYKITNNVGEYLRNIIMLQYKNLTFKDSILKNNTYKFDNLAIDKEGNMTLSNDKQKNLISVLDNEVEQLINKVHKARNEENWGTYKNLIKALIDVVGLKDSEKEKDWQLKYSEYKLDDKDGQKQIAVWEQNGDGQVRNHKIWDVGANKEDKLISINIPNDCKIDSETVAKYIDETIKTLPISSMYKTI